MSPPVEYEVALAQTFQESIGGLPAGHQAAVLEAITRLQRGHGSVHVHALSNLPWTSFCVSRDAVRIICHREDATLLLVWVDQHDAAYRWAERHAPRQFGKVVRLVTVAVDGPAPPAAEPVGERPPGPLDGIADKVFRRIDVTAGLAPRLRGLATEDELLDLCEILKPAVAEALLSLASDATAADAIVNRYTEARAGASVALRDAVKAPINSDRIWLAPPEQRAVEAALAGGGEEWRIFLHPSQKRLVEMATTGPTLVTGGPGTGKTVVALHRARHLAGALGATKERPILLTTFSHVLARQLEDGVTSVCKDAPERKERIQTLTLIGAATSVLKAARAPAALLVKEDLDAAWAEALAGDASGREAAFYAAEREEVVLAQGVTNEEAYLHASRAGRGERLDRAAKRKVWAVLGAYEAAIARRGGDDAAGLARRATEILSTGKAASPFVAVVCDEVQDASPWELRLLRALATMPDENQPGRDRLFLVGDGHQRLYQRPISLRSLGIEVRGRSARLYLNYRTTQGICAAALEALESAEGDVLETEGGEAGDAPGYRSLRAGERPEEHTFATPEAESDFIAKTIQATKARPFLVLARTRAMLKGLKDRLLSRGVNAVVLADTEVFPKGDHVVLATLHRSKGLEAPHVILAGMQESPAKFPGGTEEERALWPRKERLLRYVGMTRARDTCTLTRVGKKAARR
jgi:superfamily I DNA/RNA helicase